MRQHTVPGAVIGWAATPSLSGLVDTAGYGLDAYVAEVFIRDTVSTPSEVADIVLPYFRTEHGLTIP